MVEILNKYFPFYVRECIRNEGFIEKKTTSVRQQFADECGRWEGEYILFT
jgi:hypothetical protein